MEWSPIIPFKDLGIELCSAKNKKKLKRPIFDKLTYELIPFYYKDWGQIFRECCNNPHIKKKHYYSMEEIQELYINYIIEYGIKPTGEVKGVIEHDNRATK